MPRGTKVGIDQVVFDALTNTLYVQSDALLAQHTRFALIVTHGVRDAGSAFRAPDRTREPHPTRGPEGPMGPSLKTLR